MRVLISVDMEGIAGVAVPDDVSPGTSDYERGRHLMTREANAAVRGALFHQPDAEVVVADSHGPFTNLIPEVLDQRAKLVRGRPRPLGMVTGLEGSSAAIFIGYHGKVGTQTSVLSHTISGVAIADVRCQGRSLGETGLNAALAGHLGIPVVLVAGDDTVSKEAKEVIQGVTTVIVKAALGARAAESLHPDEACRLIEEAVPKALEQRDQVQSLRFEGAVELEVAFHREAMCEPGLLIPGVRRVDGATLAYRAEDFRVAYEVIRLMAVLAGTV
ncbi:MAG: M55 family metallopeptidase [Candidatus Dormiibacterota bacterium]